jgi:NADPH:quinone reductase-like Zn-dependent oxidoreductase
MSNVEDTNQQSRHSHNRKGSMKPITRRGIIAAGGGAVGFAALAASRGTLANTLQPVKPETDKAKLNGRFKDKVVLITGATSGIGKTTAESFAREGAKVMFCGRRENLGRQVEAGIRKFGGEATYMRADVRDPKQVKAFVDATVTKYGRLDIAFNNAGVSDPHKEI